MKTTGLDSLLNEMKYTYKRGARIVWVDEKGQKRTGTYVMASSADGYVVINYGGAHGRPAVVAVESIVKK